ncbi:hypothetical protein [Streptomyces sp. NPDC006012]|uniref:hypothetical protein n=1 Tax=Streptomyces sp. NPDC006012 TaxID=3364739 RepID=UPI00369CD45F
MDQVVPAAGAYLNFASGYWAESGAQDLVMTPAPGMVGGQVNYLQGLDFTAFDQDFGDPMDFFGPGVAQESLGHAGSAALPSATNGFVPEVPVVSVGSTRGFEDYVAFPDEVDAGLNVEPGYQAVTGVSGYAIPEEARIGVENFMRENPDWREILYGPAAPGYPPQQGFDGTDHGPSPVGHDQSGSSRILVGGYALETQSPHNSAGTSDLTEAEWRVTRLEEKVVRLQELQAPRAQLLQGQAQEGAQGTGRGTPDLTEAERQVTRLEEAVARLQNRLQAQQGRAPKR